jgi:hypothetical protein
MINKRNTRLEEMAGKQTRDILDLLNSNTTLTQQDKELTDEVAKLTREIHALLLKKSA